jgi:hypothetical protein
MFFRQRKSKSQGSAPHALQTTALREEHMLRMSENRVLRRTFVPKGEEMTGGWRRLHNEELHNLLCLIE